MKYTIQELKDIYFEASARSESEYYESIAERVERVLKGETKYCRFQLWEKDFISACFVEDDDACIVNGTYDEHVKRYGDRAELVMKMYGVKKVKAQTAETAVTVEQTEVEETAEIETEETIKTTAERQKDEVMTMKQMIDNEDYKTERKRRNRELVCRIKADAEKKYDKYWYEFQVTGNSSTERTAQKYEDIVKVCELALIGLDDECGRCRIRRKNGVEIIKSLQQSKGLGEKTVGIDDVIDYIDIVSMY